jgi:hypothetical protein
MDIKIKDVFNLSKQIGKRYFREILECILKISNYQNKY